MARPTPPEECANCGADIPRNAKACPECGADERTGWRETSIYDGLDLPDGYSENGHDHDNAISGAKRVKPVSVFWLIVGFGMLALLVLGALGLRWF